MTEKNPNVEELGAAPPSVGSVIRKLYKHQEEIASISVVVTLDDGSVDVVGDYKDETLWLRDATCMRLYAEQNLMSVIMDEFELPPEDDEID